MSLQLDNLDTVFSNADEDTREKGYEWYLDAHEKLQELCIRHDKPITQVAASTSKISPGIRWNKNLHGIKELCIFGSTQQGYRVNCDLAANILDGKYGKDFEDISQAFSTRSRKTLNFYGNLCYPLSKEFVTVDRWIYRVVATSDVTMKYIKKDEYIAISDRIREIATQYKVLPNMVQATIWEAIKSTKDRRYESI